MKRFLIPGILSLVICIGIYYGASIICDSLPGNIGSADTVLGYLMNFSAIFTVILGIWKRDEVMEYIKRWKTKPDFTNAGEPFEIPVEKFKAAVIPVSRREQPEWIIRHLTPEYVSLIFTEETKEAAKGLVRDFSDRIKFFPNIEEMDDPSYILSSPDKVEQAKEKAEKYIRHYIKEGMELSNIFVDTTGGKVPMSIGLFQAAEQAGVSSIYIIGTQKGFIAKPEIREHGRPVFMSDHASDKSG